MDKKLLGLVIFFLLTFSLFTTLLMFQKPLSKFTKAKEESIASANKTLLFAWPLTVMADGKSESTITIFIRNEKESPIANKKVTLNTDLGIIKEVQSVSGNNGKAEFKISSQVEGVANIKATVDNIPITQTLSIRFLNQ